MAAEMLEWVLCHSGLTEKDIRERVHPDDRDRAAIVNAHAFLARVSKVDESYVQLDFGFACFRVTRKALEKHFRPVETLRFTFGDKVRVKDRGHEGEIAEISWHYKNEQACYFIRVDGKLKKTRYFEAELEPA